MASLTDDLRARTRDLFGLPDGERVDWELVRDQPWAGFNYYLGDLRSRVAINVDLPVLSPGLAHLVAHESLSRPSFSKTEHHAPRRSGWSDVGTG